MTNEPIDTEQHYATWTIRVVNERWLWLFLAMGATGIVYVAYLLTHPYPAYGGGFFLEIVEQIQRNGYALPSRIPGYTSGGVPFAYPPLMFYIAAVILDITGIDPITFTRYFPGLIVILALVPYYLSAEFILEDVRKAGLATVFLGLTPTTLRWHLSAGGFVRASAFFLVLVGLYTGLQLFTTHDRRWLAASTIVFALVVLTHPTYTAFFVLTYLILYAAFDRSVHGLLYGSIVGFGGTILAMPWWAQIVARHGWGIYETASGTHGGLGGTVGNLAVGMTTSVVAFDIEGPFFVAAYLGGLYALSQRRFFLPAWMAITTVVIGKNRFMFLAGAMLTAVLVMEVLSPLVQWAVSKVKIDRSVSTMVVGIVAIAAVVAGTLYGAGAVDAAHESSAAQPQYFDAYDVEAAQWSKRATPDSATFVVLGDAAEWFPYLSKRTILIGPWGVEWESTEGYYHQMELIDRISVCPHAACVSQILDHEGLNPNYVYIPKDEFTVRGREHVQSPEMRPSLIEADQYTVVFENKGVIIAEVTDQS